MNVKATSILLAMLFVILLPEGSAFTAGAKVPLQGKREQVHQLTNFFFEQVKINFLDWKMKPKQREQDRAPCNIIHWDAFFNVWP